MKYEINLFQESANRNLRIINRQLLKKSFKFKPAKGVPIPKDKKDKKSFRPIVLAPIESRIVQRAVLNVLLEQGKLKKYFLNPYSFGGIKKRNKGDIAGVPAAIQAVIRAIDEGANYVICSDISKFFTRISKTSVSKIVFDSTKDCEFIQLFDEAINVELQNMAELRERADAFPINDIGVAQGNSLSPLLGNLILHEFDAEMNSTDCPCLRYIDDFIILAPTKRAAKARLGNARRLLKEHGMYLADNKTHREPQPVKAGFEFLGIEINNGLLKPAKKAQRKFLDSIDETFLASEKAFFEFQKGKPLQRTKSLLGTLKRIDGIMSGWSKHYRFCNDEDAFINLEKKISQRTKKFIGIYASVRDRLDDNNRVKLFGLTSLTEERKNAFQWSGATKAPSSDTRPILIPQLEELTGSSKAIVLPDISPQDF